MRRTILAVGAVALCSIAAATAGAQYMSLNEDAPNWGLNSHEVRVVQLALRDVDCYDGRIDGQVGPRTRRALECAHQKTSDDPEQMEQELALYQASFVATADGRNTTETTTREAAGDVELAPQRDTTDQMQQMQMEPQVQPRMQQQMRDSTMMMRDSMMMMRDSMMMMRDSMMMPRDTMMMPRDTTMMPPPRDTTMMPPRDTTMFPRDTTMMPPPRDTTMFPRDTTTMPRDTTSMPMPRDTTRTPPDTSTGRIPPPR